MSPFFKISGFNNINCWRAFCGARWPGYVGGMDIYRKDWITRRARRGDAAALARGVPARILVLEQQAAKSRREESRRQWKAQQETAAHASTK